MFPSRTNVYDKTNPQSGFTRAWELIEQLDRHRCIYYEDSTAGTELDPKLKRRCAAAIGELREAKRIHDERCKELARMSVWSRRKTGAELEREIFELRIEVCQLIEFCCDLLLENNSLMAKSLMKPLKDEAAVLKLKSYGQRCLAEHSLIKLHPHPRVLPEADRYDMRSRRIALVLCVLTDRDGAVHDIRRLRSIFVQHGFHYNIELNPTEMGVFLAISRFRSSLLDRNTGVSCCVVVIMAHGRNGYITASDGGEVKLQDIFNRFNNRQCPALRQRPKAFIVQACRGGKSKDTSFHDAISTRQSGVPLTRLPLTSDTLVAYAACPGKVAHRHPEYGCHLTVEMESVFKEHARTHHMYELFTKVNSELVHSGWCQEGYEQDRAPQVPESLFQPWRQPAHSVRTAKEDKTKNPMHIQSTLTKKWYL